MNKQTPPGNAPAPINQTRDVMPSELAELTQGDTGQGVSFDRDDILTPLLDILQTNSPACSPRDAAYIAGAEPGHWRARNALNPIISGVAGVPAIHCGQRHVWIEYAPQRGGLSPSTTSNRLIWWMVSTTKVGRSRFAARPRTSSSTCARSIC
jgi:hypothetical protein